MGVFVVRWDFLMIYSQRYLIFPILSRMEITTSSLTTFMVPPPQKSICLLWKRKSRALMDYSFRQMLKPRRTPAALYNVHLVKRGRLNNITFFNKMWYNSGAILELYHKVIIWMKNIFLLPTFIGNVGKHFARHLNNITFHLINITFYLINITFHLINITFYLINITTFHLINITFYLINITF